MSDTCWRDLISEEMRKRGEGWRDMIGKAPLDADWLDVRFNDGYGGSEGCAFTVWTERRVYFPAVYDGAEWCASVPRNPCDEATGHVGDE